MKTAQDYVVMALVAAVCVLGTIVGLGSNQSSSTGCTCDHSAIESRLNTMQSSLTFLTGRVDQIQQRGGSIGSPIGKSVGSPAP